MDMRCFPISLYMCATLFYVCMICVFILISLFGLHSFVKMCTNRIISGGGIYLVSLLCSSI